MVQQLPPTLWWEDDSGKRWVPSYDEMNDMSPPPPGFRFMHTRFPLQLKHRVYDRGTDGKSTVICQMETSCNGSLVMAMTRPSLVERVRTLLRGYPQQERYNPHDAVLIAGIACEKCQNVMAHRYGLKWGYPEGSPHWMRVNTSCELCRRPGDPHEVEFTIPSPGPC